MFAVLLGFGATALAIKSGEIASMFAGGYRPVISRATNPFMFWSGIAFYGLVSTIGVVALIGSIIVG